MTAGPRPTSGRYVHPEGACRERFLRQDLLCRLIPASASVMLRLLPRQVVAAVGALLLLACDSGTGPSPSNWVQRASLPEGPLVGAVSFVVQGKLYVGAGLRGTFTNEFYQFDPTTNRWKEVTALPAEVRYAGVGFAIGDYGYTGLGGNFCLDVGAEAGTCDSSYFNDLWRYDPVIDKWRRAADFPGSGRVSAVAFVIRDRAYVTGLSTSGAYDMWEYEPVANSWTRKADYPGGCGVRGTAFSVGGYGYVDFGYTNGAACQDFWRYEPFADAWTPVAAFPGSARHEAVGFSDGLLDAPPGFVAAGSDGARDPSYLTDMWTYNAAGDTWVQLQTAYPGKGRSQMTAGILDGRIFLGLGTDDSHGGNRFDDWWEYVPDN